MSQIQPTDHGYNPYDFDPLHHHSSSSSYPSFPEITVHRHNVHNLDSIYEWRKKLELYYRLADENWYVKMKQIILYYLLCKQKLTQGPPCTVHICNGIHFSTFAPHCNCVAACFMNNESASGNMALRRWQSTRSPDVFTRLWCTHTGEETQLRCEMISLHSNF